MYHPDIVDRNLAQVEAALGLKLTRYGEDSVDDMTEHLKGLVKSYDKDGRPKEWNREPTQQEWAYITNERIMAKYDFRYFADRYCHIRIVRADGSPVGVDRLGKHGFMRTQEALLTRLANDEKEMYEQYDKGQSIRGLLYFVHKARQTGFCLTSDSKVLTTNLVWKSIKDIRANDIIVSTDEDIKGGSGPARKLRAAVVEACTKMEAPTLRLTTVDGHTIVSTPHHKFLVLRGVGYRWVEVQDLKPGDRIRRLCPFEDTESTYEDGWFAGILDGEGWLRRRSSGSAELGVCQTPGPVADRIRRYLVKNNYTFRESVDTRRASDSSKLGSKNIHSFYITRMDQIFRLLIKTRPSRLLQKDWWEGSEIPSGKSEEDRWAVVASVEEAGNNTVYDLQTSTHTYIADGLVTHNTALVRMMEKQRVFYWPDTMALAASENLEMVQELYRRDKVLWENTPWFMRPSLKYDTKDEQLEFEGTNSVTLYHQGNQKGGLGTGKTISVAHLTECALWDRSAANHYDNTRKILDDLYPAIPRSLNTLYVMESTAMGIGGFWYDQVELIRSGSSRFNLFFCPWYAADDKYSETPPPGWVPDDFVVHQAMTAEATSQEYLGYKVKLTRNQLYWYQKTMEEHTGRLFTFFSNYPTTIEESFQNSGDCAFSYELLKELSKGIGQLHGGYDLAAYV